MAGKEVKPCGACGGELKKHVCDNCGWVDHRGKAALKGSKKESAKK